MSTMSMEIGGIDAMSDPAIRLLVEMQRQQWEKVGPLVRDVTNIDELLVDIINIATAIFVTRYKAKELQGFTSFEKKEQ